MYSISLMGQVTLAFAHVRGLLAAGGIGLVLGGDMLGVGDGRAVEDGRRVTHAFPPTVDRMITT
jgi:hypothetical protein